MQFPYNRKLSFGILDITLLIVIISGLFVFFSGMKESLDYRWEWNVIPTYLFKINSQTGWISPNILLQGFITTIKLSIWSMVIALFLGVITGFMRAQGKTGQRFISFLYVESVRNIPSLVLVFIFYFFVSSQFLDHLNLDSWMRESPESIKGIIEFLFTEESSINNFISAVITLGIYEGAYISEIIRGGISGVGSGQWEAGYSIGLNSRKTFLLIIFPQAARKIASPLAGQFISTIKDSSIVSVISIQELTFQGMEVMAATYLTFEVWITITLLYFVLTFSLSRIVSYLDVKYKLIT